MHHIAYDNNSDTINTKRLDAFKALLGDEYAVRSVAKFKHQSNEDRQDDYLRKSIFAQYIRYENEPDCCGGTSLNLDKVVAVIRYFANSAKMSHLYKVKVFLYPKRSLS